jgi:hypothetical protein
MLQRSPPAGTHVVVLLVHKRIIFRKELSFPTQTLVLDDKIHHNLACQVQLINWNPRTFPGHQQFLLHFALSSHTSFTENLHDGLTVILLDDIPTVIFGEPRVRVVDEVFHHACYVTSAPSANFDNG